MTKAVRKLSPLSRDLLEIAADMREGGILDAATHEKITMRHLGAHDAAEIPPVSAEDVKAMREKAQMSQAVFAHHLNLTVGYISKLERGAIRPTGSTLALLHVIRRKGMEAIL